MLTIAFSFFVDMIDKATKEIKQDDEETVYKSLDEISDDLPDHSPRFVLLSYPMTLVRCRNMERRRDCDTSADGCYCCRIPAEYQFPMSSCSTSPSQSMPSFECCTPAQRSCSGIRPR